MRINWNAIQLVLLSVAIAALYSFANHRSTEKKVNGIAITFVGNSTLYLTEEAVHKLLTQKYGSLQNTPRETVVLDAIERAIVSNTMVKKAQVYCTVDGVLIAKIVQRKPLGRVGGAAPFYLDDAGKRMPLSPYHSARVPLISGKITEQTLADAYTLLNHIHTDDFLKKNVIGIHAEAGKYQLKLRSENFVVHLGSVNHFNKKLKNFSAFYAKAAKDYSLHNYTRVNLEFDHQVVCTKL